MHPAVLKDFVWNFTFLEIGSVGQRSNYKITRFVVVSKDSLIVSCTVLIEGWYIKVSQMKYFHDLYWQTNKVVNGAHLELSTETLVKFPHLGLISLDLEKKHQKFADFFANHRQLLLSWEIKFIHFRWRKIIYADHDEINPSNQKQIPIKYIGGGSKSCSCPYCKPHTLNLLFILFRNLDLVWNVGLLGNCSMLALFEN